MKRQNNNYSGFCSKTILIRLCPVVIVLLFILHIEFQAWKTNSRRQLILNTPREAICEPSDTVCRQCPFFREKVVKMNQCVRDILDERISNDDVGFVVNSIPYSVQKCNLKWLMSQRAIQMIKQGNTQFILTPANPRAPLVALVIGSDENFDMEKQLAENMTRVQFYGTNFANAEIALRFKKRLNGIKIRKNLKTSTDTTEKEESTALFPREFFQKYFPKRPLDIVFIHLNDTNQDFIDQLMGKGTNGVNFPVCQVNIEITIPSKLSSARQFVQWFKQFNTKMKPLQRQYLIGYSTIVIESGEMRLRFYAINVGQTKCVAKFLTQSECRALIGSEFDSE